MKAWIIVLAASVLGGCGSAAVPDTSRPPEPTAQWSTDALPDGWRWESYGGVELAVPGHWGHGTSNQAWCAWGKNSQLGAGPPYVGRPGVMLAIACAETDDRGRDPGTLVESGGTFVWFGGPVKADNRAVTIEGDRATLTLAGILVSVQADRDLREQILSTLREIPDGTDGCPSTHPVGEDPAWRPSGVPVEELSGVMQVSACKYAGSILRSSLLIRDEAAAKAIEAVAASPLGGGPDTPDTCVEEAAYGDEVIVLLVESEGGIGEIVLRYSGCDHHGFDDGSSVRTLTREAVAPFVAGPNFVMTSSESLSHILHG